MKNRNFSKELEKRLNSEEIALPESLSAESIENFIRENGEILSPKRRKPPIKNRIIKFTAAAAAVFTILIGIAAILNTSINHYELKKQDNIVAQKTEDSDYSEVENVILSYFKNYYNDNYGNKNLYNNFLNNVTSSSKDHSAENGVPTLDESADTLAGSGSYSTTNLQVKDADEGDIIKNDGKYLYYIGNNKIYINDCRKPENMQTVSKIEFKTENGTEYYPREMYLYGGKMVVVLDKQTDSPDYNEYTTVFNGAAMSDCIAYVIPNDIEIRIYDISDKSNPKLENSFAVNGSYLASRIIGGKLLTVSNYHIPYSGCGMNTFGKSCDALKKVDIPRYSVNGGEDKKVSSDRIKIVNEDEPSNYIVTSLISLDNPESEPILDASLCSGQEIYCTDGNLFIAESECSYWYRGETHYVTDDRNINFSTVTHIYKYDITDEGVLYKAAATVGGICINRFSMDKSGDTFRIATCGAYADKTETDGETVSVEIQEDFSMVYTLDNDMKIIGYLGEIAKGENMQAARFMGDTLYLVTFYRTDPLFVIDLSDKTKPVIKGELKIPGFSSYLHPVGNNLVIGIGTGGDADGADNSAKISLFDVSEPENPKETDNYTVGNAYFNSNHKAFMTVDSNTFGISMIESYYNNAHDYCEDYSVLLMDFSKEGLTLRGKYKTAEYDENDSEKNSTVIDVIRGAFIGNTVFVVNENGIAAYSMTDNSKTGEIKF